MHGREEVDDSRHHRLLSSLLLLGTGRATQEELRGGDWLV